MKLCRESLIARVADAIRERILAKEWAEELPPVRLLASQLGISIPTLRAAETILAKEGLVEIHHGKPTRIFKVERGIPAHRKCLGLLATRERFEPNPNSRDVLLLETSLREAGYEIFRYQLTRLLLARDGAKLRELFTESAMHGWILISVGGQVHQIAADLRLNAFIVGSCQDDLPLPSADLDYAAISRHAAGELLRRGHRRFTVLTPAAPPTGDRLSVQAFSESIEKDPQQRGGIVDVLEMDGDSNHIARDLGRLMRRESPPTAIYSIQQTLTISSLTWFLRNGFRVPEDVSVMNRDFSELLHAAIPSVGGYKVGLGAFSERLARSVIQFFVSGSQLHSTMRVFPDFLPGESLGPTPR